MDTYQLSYTGAQINAMLGNAINPDSTPTDSSTKFVTSDGLYDVIGNVESLLSAI